MNIQSTAKAMVLAKNEKPSIDGKNTYYNLAIMVGGEAGNISCTEDAYKFAEIGVENELALAYNDQYKTLRVLDARAVTPFTPKGTAPTPATDSDKKSGK